MLRNLLYILFSVAMVFTARNCGADNVHLTLKPSVIRNVQLVTMTERGVLQDMAVIVDNGRIAEILPNNDVVTDRDQIEVDGRGGFLVPGYVDAHYHYRHADELLNFLAYGVTTVVNLGQDLKETRELVALRESISRGEFVGPKIYTTERIIANGIDLNTVDQVHSHVKMLAAEGYDFVKIYNEIPKEVFDAVVAAASAQNLSVFGHIPRNFSSTYSLSNGLDVVAHAEEFYFSYFEGARDKDFDSFDASQRPDTDKIEALVELLVTNDVALIPTLAGSFAQMVFWDDQESVFADPELSYLHPRLTNLWRSMNVLQRKPLDKRMAREQIKYALSHEITYRLHEAGAMIVTGTDTALPNVAPGKSIHRELRELVKSGLNYEEALSATTSDAGQFIKKYVDNRAKIGQIKEDFEADLVLLRKNPLDSILNARNILGVMTDGAWYSAEYISGLREERATRYADLRSLASDVRDAVLAKSDQPTILSLFHSYGLTDADTYDYTAHLVEGIAFEFFSDGSVDEAIRILILNSKLFPQVANVWDTLGDVYMHLEKPDEALEAYRTALEIDENFEHSREQIRKIEALNSSMRNSTN